VPAVPLKSCQPLGMYHAGRDVSRSQDLDQLLRRSAKERQRDSSAWTQSENWRRP